MVRGQLVQTKSNVEYSVTSDRAPPNGGGFFFHSVKNGNVKRLIPQFYHVPPDWIHPI